MSARKPPSVMVALALVAAIFHLLYKSASAAPFLVTDLYTPACTPISDPPPNGFLKWSDGATWAPNPVPGIGATAGANATIPCNVAVVLDVPLINVTVLRIQGFLKVLDGPGTPASYNVYACFVLVEGQLTIGSSARQFQNQITFTLLPNPWGRKDWSAGFNPPSDPTTPRVLGHKAFAVMGGQVHLHGMPGGAATPSWVKLNGTGNVGDLFIVVDTDVSKTWPIGGQIAISATDWWHDQAEQFTILGYDTSLSPPGTIIYLDSPLKYMHFGDPFGIPDGFGGFVDERAEVALLTRNILITGLDEPPPYHLEGGHFIVFQTAVPQYIEGVEYFLMGQQGVLGRYNIHFHICGDTQNQSVVRKNAIHNSKQRCVVVHATHNLTVDSNVAYNTSGHCFMVEEGGEQDNTFVNNLGFLTRAVQVLIPNSDPTLKSDESDDRPATFWITNMKNNYINNVAAGSAESGFWAELRPAVRGASLRIPGLATILPQSTPLGTYQGLVAHSNRGPGWRCYPNGIRPRMYFNTNSTSLPTWQWPPATGVFSGFRIFKHSGDGFFMHNSERLTIVNCTFADNTYSVNILGNVWAQVVNSRFVGQGQGNIGTVNLGQCAGGSANWLCAPIRGCVVNASDPKNLRTRGWSYWLNPSFGVAIDQVASSTDGPHAISNCQFSGYDSTCGRPQAAIGLAVNGQRRQFWSAGMSVQGIVTAPSVLPVFFPPSIFTFPSDNSTLVGGEAGSNYVLWDKDGSVSGGSGGTVVFNSPALLPPRRVPCSPLAAGTNAVGCPGACYRTVVFLYQEDNFTLPPATSTYKRGDFSFLSIKRVEDNATRISDGNLVETITSTGNTGTQRKYFANLFAPATYEVSIGLPYGNMGFWPGNLTVYFQDQGVCGAGVTLRIMSVPYNQWAIAPSDTTFWSPCPGTTWRGNSTAWPVQFSYICYRQRSTLQLKISGSHYSQIFLTNSNQRVAPCSLPYRCGVWTSSDWYYYNTSAQDLRSPRPGYMGFTVPTYDQSSWGYGQAILGWVGWNWWAMKTWLPQSSSSNPTFYFRKSFTVANSACYSGIYFDFVFTTGIIMYLNNIEVFRFNIAPGNVSSSTLSLNSYGFWPNFYNTTFINITASNASFVEGTNYVAFETHVSQWQSNTNWDSRLSLASTAASCQGASVMPEICDGLDNNFDGLVDVDPATGKPLVRPCATSCGVGMETCLGGSYVNCTAPPSNPETCNGIDDNCDGFVDNGLNNTQLDCAAGLVCFAGKCLRPTPLTQPATLIPRSSPGWLYYEKGWMWQSYPQWPVGSPPVLLGGAFFKQGTAPFGTAATTGTFSTVLNPTSGDINYYFLRTFNLSAADAANTYSLSLNVRRDSGITVYINGAEFFRNNMPQGPIQEFTYPINRWTNTTAWYSNTPLRATGISNNTIKAGTNWLAVMVTVAQWSSTALFDLELIRNVNVSCASLPGSPPACVRSFTTDTVFFPFNSVWSYLDASYPLPPYSWINTAFDASSWPTAQASLGSAWTTTVINMTRPRVAYYFRKTFNAPDGPCYYNLTFNLQARDGAVVYVNGLEAYRFQIQPQWVFPWSYSSNSWPAASSATFTLPTGWLLPGLNSIAVELHLSSLGTTSWIFDLSLTGQREAATCLPLPA